MRVDWAAAPAALLLERLRSENMASYPTDFVPVVSDGFSCSKQLEKLEGSSQNVFSLLLLIPLQVTPAAIHCILVHNFLIGQKVLVPSPAAATRAGFFQEAKLEPQVLLCLAVVGEVSGTRLPAIWDQLWVDSAASVGSRREKCCSPAPFPQLGPRAVNAKPVL